MRTLTAVRIVRDPNAAADAFELIFSEGPRRILGVHVVAGLLNVINGDPARLVPLIEVCEQYRGNTQPMPAPPPGGVDDYRPDLPIGQGKFAPELRDNFDTICLNDSIVGERRLRVGFDSTNSIKLEITGVGPHDSFYLDVDHVEVLAHQLNHLRARIHRMRGGA